MKRASPVRQRLAALGLVAIPLLTFPLLSLPQGEWFGMPAAYAYLFGVWALVVGIAAAVAGRGD